MKRFISLWTAMIMFVLSAASIAAASEGKDYSVQVLYENTESGYNVSGIYQYPDVRSETLLAILAVYDNGILTTVKTQDIEASYVGTTASISGVPAQKGNIVKGMLWEKTSMEPLASTAEEEIKEDKATPMPTAAASSSPTPSASPSFEPTAVPNPSSSASPSPAPTAGMETQPPLPSEPISYHWDFSVYAEDNSISADGELTEIYTYETDGETIEIHLNNGDSITDVGLYWSAPSGTKSDSTTTVTNNRYIKYTPSTDGVLSITYKGSANASNKHPRMYVSCGDSIACTTKDSSDAQLEKNQSYDNNSTDFKTAEFYVNKGRAYYIWSYYYNSTSNQFTISDIVFTSAEATVTTRNIYGSNMLLQRNEPIVIDGKAGVADAVTVTLTNETTNEIIETVSGDTVSADSSWSDMDWSVTLSAVSDYNSTYKLTISADGAETVEYTNILFGDLYLFTGQSNMWKQVSYYKNIDSDAYGTAAVEANATDKIRVMHTQGSGDYGTSVLQYNAQNRQEWRDFSTYNNVSDIAAPAYTAAVRLKGTSKN